MNIHGCLVFCEMRGMDSSFDTSFCTPPLLVGVGVGQEIRLLMWNGTALATPVGNVTVIGCYRPARPLQMWPYHIPIRVPRVPTSLLPERAGTNPAKGDSRDSW